jgi:hypothetical protein
MYYRVYQINNAMYPGWGYNLNFLELNQMAIWWLNSIFESEMIEEEKFNEKSMVLTNNIEEESLIAEIQYLGELDGGLEVEKSEILFDEAGCDDIDDMNNRPWN